MTAFLDPQPFAIFVAAGADAIARPWLGLAGAITFLCGLYDICQEWARVEPAPARRSPRVRRSRARVWA